MEALSSCYSCFMSLCLGLTIGSFSLEFRFSRGRMKGEELIGEILRPAAKALGWIIAGALLVMFIWAVVTYVVPVIRRRLYGNE